MKDIYSTEERNKMLNMAMKQYECCGIGLELGDYFIITDYPSMLFKVRNDSLKGGIRLVYTFISEQSFSDARCNGLFWYDISDECLKRILNTMINNSYEHIRKRYKYYTNLKENFCLECILKDMKDIFDNGYTKSYQTRDLIIYWNLIDKIIRSDYKKYKQNGILEKLKNLEFVCVSFLKKN